MPAVVVDTHALVWYLTDPARLSPNAGDAIDRAVAGGDSICVSAISLVELVYLVDKGRLPPWMIDRLKTALEAEDSERFASWR